ncbi:MAG: ABC transporter permease [Saprospiraceae bacterium]|nr:ABC transporter permease [Saprospiraceae bacterium]MCF8248570.1 ABC transporter permease [Saprospiraceae bacterium]MCF8280263.1 ABC transporter permease [Bacteroidales bacterium]MCF8310303.1 ABC transporter permease [Saprospiraceae bacterium]MCF8439257.1 ABC transporter permease [Saprospiraceae bacterium]
MFKNYLKIAFRSFQKQRFYAAINILGLSIGIACCLLISLFVWDEMNFDRQNEKFENIYRVTSDLKFGGKREIYAVAQAPLAAALREDVPEVETAGRFRPWGNRLVKKEGTQQNFNEQRFAWADNQLFDVFTFPLLGGDKSSLLTMPNTIAISETAAKRHFGTLNPIGQNLILDNEMPVKVTGVFKDMPRASHFHYDFLLSMEGLDDAKTQSWGSHNYQTYIVMKPGQSVATVEKKISEIFHKYGSAQIKQGTGFSMEELEAKGFWARYTLLPLKDIHLKSNFVAEHEPNSDESYVWIFGAIALFILLIACINFMNLSTARSASRSKEVGMRKVLGSVKKQLVGQFLTEAILMSGFAFLLAVIFASFAMPFFNQLTNKELSLPLTNPTMLSLLFGGVILVGLLAGSYPAFYLSAFKPLEVLKGKIQNNIRTGWLRHSLVVFQFTISTLLLVGTVVIYRQLDFIQQKRLGFDKEQLVTINSAGDLASSFEGFRNDIEAMPEVKSATSTCFLPVTSCRSDNTTWIDSEGSDRQHVNLQCWTVDDSYELTLGLEMSDGRFFSKEFKTDSTAIVLNEEAVKKYGFVKPVGRHINMYNDNQMKDFTTYTVVGVVKNFNFENLRDEIGPLAFFYDQAQTGPLTIRLDGNTNISGFIDKIKSKWEASSSGLPFDYAFLDERFTRMYESEQRLGNIFIVFAGLAIFIACLGLLALAAFTAERRSKEIGVRKVLGATSGNIIRLLTSEFSRWVILSNLIALPLAWWGAHRWLENFAYRTEVDWWLMAGAFVTVMVIALLTVSFQSIKAALANPVKSLRSE